jgi:hypothetical protein
MSIPLLRRATVAAASLAALATALPAQAVTSSVAAPSTTLSTTAYQQRAGQAASWQASQLSRGRIHNGQFGFDDWGLTVDTGLMLAADGSQQAKLARLQRTVRNHYADYTGKGGEKYAGAVAKTLVLVRVLRKNPRDFGSANVRAQLRRLMDRSGPDRGRFSDASEFGDNSNVIGQSYAVLGLARTGGVPQAAVGYLLKQRCPAGFFRLFPVTGQTCRQSDGSPDVDATSLAVQALLSARQHGATVPAGSIRESARWLASAQRRNGSFGGGFTTQNSNSNSTGLAANALIATGHRAARLRAADWAAKLQITRARAGDGPARTDVGAIAYRPAALQRALREGIGVKKRDQFRRATPQAYFALEPAPLNTLLAPR